MSTARTMANPPTTGGGVITLFSSLSFPSLHAYWLFILSKATEGQARRHTLCSSSYAKGTLTGLVPRAWNREGSGMWKSE